MAYTRPLSRELLAETRSFQNGQPQAIQSVPVRIDGFQQISIIALTWFGTNPSGRHPYRSFDASVYSLELLLDIARVAGCNKSYPSGVREGGANPPLPRNCKR